MPPAVPNHEQAPDRRLQQPRLRLAPLSLSALVVGISAGFVPLSAHAQDLTRQVETGPISGQPPAPAKPADSNAVPVAFAADNVEYDQNGDTVTATGNVVLRRQDPSGQDQSVRADKVTWNRKTGKIFATGNVRLVDQNGNQAYVDSAELTDEFKTGTMENLLLALREGGRLAAKSGQREANGDVQLTRAAYTGCDVTGPDGCPRTPTWKILADKVNYSQNQQRIRFSNARLELFNTLQIPLFGVTVSTDGDSVSGFLMPKIGSSSSNGIGLGESYYWKIAPDKDLTATATAYTESEPMGELQYRQLTSLGAFQITGYLTSSRRTGIADLSDPNTTNGLRGYIFANGTFQFDPHWSATVSIRRATDRTFLRRYDISNDDRLRSTINVERIDQDSYLSIAAYATQTMTAGMRQGQIPIAVPVIDYRHRYKDPLLGGTIETELNTLGIVRSAGQDTQRAFAKAQWSLRKITPWGQEVTFTGLLRGDIYHSSENDLNDEPIYAGQPGWQGRVIATAAVDVKYPLVGAVWGGTEVFTPRIQLVATPKTRNLSIPDEDSRSIELEDDNIFSLNRYPGYDRVEDGVRLTYGFDWQFERPRWKIKTNIGQSIRLEGGNDGLQPGTGLTGTFSDIVGRTEIRYRDFVSLIHRFRVDKSTFKVHRNEIDASVGSRKTYLEVGYTKLDRNIETTLGDLSDREEVRAAARAAFHNYWSMFGSAVINLTGSSDSSTNTASTSNYGSDGFQPLRTRLGIAYEDDCLQVALTWRRNYISNGDAKRGDSFMVSFALKNLGSR